MIHSRWSFIAIAAMLACGSLHAEQDWSEHMPPPVIVASMDETPGNLQAGVNQHRVELESIGQQNASQFSPAASQVRPASHWQPAAGSRSVLVSPVASATQAASNPATSRLSAVPASSDLQPIKPLNSTGTNASSNRPATSGGLVNSHAPMNSGGLVWSDPSEWSPSTAVSPWATPPHRTIEAPAPPPKTKQGRYSPDSPRQSVPYQESLGHYPSSSGPRSTTGPYVTTGPHASSPEFADRGAGPSSSNSLHPSYLHHGSVLPEMPGVENDPSSAGPGRLGMGTHWIKNRPKVNPPIPEATVAPRWKAPYSYGYFGAEGKRHWTRQHGYRDRYLQWSLR
ncbi:hypothetical protein [Neorhodopirellula lusitana]|uniref:hypothetical protein n=1 Tax=Neorhodopirellula lusitana TaxID=445327 RepID=UPI00385121D3